MSALHKRPFGKDAAISKTLTINALHHTLFCNFTPTPYFWDILSLETEEKTASITTSGYSYRYMQIVSN